jgi:protein-S-isoprenylcysteine O-methyltransferase Ste14
VVRNPMAVAGLGQGIAVGLLYLSLPIMFYCLLGALVWHLVIRPIEEENLLSRFGSRYAEYRRDVRCWMPRVSKQTV